jgi:hypothetical protein
MIAARSIGTQSGAPENFSANQPVSVIDSNSEFIPQRLLYE